MAKRIIVLCFTLIIVITSVCYFNDSNNITLTVKKSILGQEDFVKQDKALKQFITAFNKEYPNVKISINYVTEYPAKLKDTELILFGADEMIEYAPKDLKILTDRVSIDNMPEKIAETGSLSLNSEKKDLYMIPFNYDRAVVYLDKTVFEFLEVDIPTAQWTYEEFLQIAEKTTKKKCYFNEYRDIVGIHLPIGKPYVWKYFFDNIGDGWYNEYCHVSFNSDKSLEVMEDVLTLCKKYAKCYPMTSKSTAMFGAMTAMAWVNACSPEYDDYRIIEDEIAYSLVGRRAKQLAEEGNLILLPLPSVNGVNMSYSNTEFIKGIGISSYISDNKLDNAIKIAEFTQTYEGNSALNSYYGGIPSNKNLWDEDYWKTGCLINENANNVLIGIENDKRDDYTDLLHKDEAIYEKNIRMRAICSGILMQDLRESPRNITGFEELMKKMGRFFNATITFDGVPMGYNQELIEKED